MLDHSSFSELYLRYQDSGLTVRNFCHNEGIHETTFYYWTRKRKQRQQHSSGDFIPLVIENTSALPALSEGASGGSPDRQVITACEITLPTGARIKFKGELSPDSLQVLLGVLSR